MITNLKTYKFLGAVYIKIKIKRWAEEMIMLRPSEINGGDKNRDQERSQTIF